MGGFMSYQRMRNRNGLLYRTADDDPDPYWRGLLKPASVLETPQEKSRRELLVGDMNRMERDYLGICFGPHHPQRQAREQGITLSHEVAEMTGVDVETVMRVLRYVFMEQA